MHLKGQAQQVRAALPPSDTLKYATMVNSLEQQFRQKHLPPVKRRELKNEGIQDYVADIRHFTQEPYLRMNPNLWRVLQQKILSIVRIHDGKCSH